MLLLGRYEFSTKYLVSHMLDRKTIKSVSVFATIRHESAVTVAVPFLFGYPCKTFPFQDFQEGAICF